MFAPSRRWLVRLCICASILAGAPGPARAIDPGTWGAIAPPSTRFSHVAVYDSRRDRMIVIGGADADDQVWALDLAPAVRWVHVPVDFDANQNPYAFSEQAAVYDSLRDRILLFSGAYGLCELSLGNSRWSVLIPVSNEGASRPGYRAGLSMILDPVRDRLLVYGGRAQPTNTPASDVWALPLDAPYEWTQLTPSGPAPRRAFHSAIYDPVRDRMLVFGGLDDTNLLHSDCHALELAGAPEWSDLAAIGAEPTPRARHSAIYDPERRRMVVFGGTAGALALNDVRELDLDALEWFDGEIAIDAVGKRQSHTAIYDPLRRRMLVYGGFGPAYSFFFERDNRVWARTLGPSPAWSALAATASIPSRRIYHSATYDARRRRMIAFGGFKGDTTANDTWALDLEHGSGWTRLAAGAIAPAVRYQHSSVYDAASHRVLIFGGNNGSEFGGNQNFDDTWSLALDGAPAWAEVATLGTRPEPRRNHAAVYDPIRDRMLVLGGDLETNDPGACSPCIRGDLWELTLSGTPTWTQLAPAGPAPPARREQAMVYDPIRDRVIVLGGEGNGSEPLSDVWQLDLATLTWSEIATGGLAPDITSIRGIVTYDPVRDRLVVARSGMVTPEISVLPLSGPSMWSTFQYPTLRPIVRDHHSAIYDPRHDRVVIFGGDDFGDFFQDTWALEWAEPVLPTVGCPELARWDPGSDLTMAFAISNPSNFSRPFAWSVASERNWPGAAQSTIQWLGPFATDTARVTIAIPDTAAPGRNRLTFRAGLPGAMEDAAQCIHVLYDRMTAVTASIAEVDASPNRVRIRWLIGDPPSPTAEVLRGATAETRRVVTVVSVDGRGFAEFEDRLVAPGDRWSYALRFRGGESIGDIWVDVPGTSPFAVHGIRGSASGGPLAVSLSLPRAGNVRVQVTDVSGRTRLGLSTALGAGAQDLRLAGSEHWRPGVYFVRIRFADQVVDARAIVLR